MLRLAPWHLHPSLARLLGGLRSWRLEVVTGGTSPLLQADPEKWTDFDEVLRVNPVSAINEHLRRTLEREHNAALESDRAARTFKQFRLNLPGDPIDTQPLITNSEWERVCARPVPEC